jgi:tetratricopeptide (TPR) repeat protein
MKGGVIAAVLVLALAAGPALAERAFPGKGSKAQWVEASKMYDAANAARRNGNSKLAIELYRKAISRYPYDASFYNNLGALVGRELGDWTQAVNLTRKALQLDPRSLTAQFNLGKNLAEAGKYAEAKVALKSLIKTAPGSAEAQQAAKLMSEIDVATKNAQI